MSEATATLDIKLSFDQSINYAFQQNAIPVIKELRLLNNREPLKNLVIRVTTEPAFANPLELHLQALDLKSEYRVSPLDLKLSHDFLAGLNEKVSGYLRVEVFTNQGGTENPILVESRTESITLLARNEWCGLVSLPEILAAFVLPNDPAIMSLLDRASELLKKTPGGRL